MSGSGARNSPNCAPSLKKAWFSMAPCSMPVEPPAMSPRSAAPWASSASPAGSSFAMVGHRRASSRLSGRLGGRAWSRTARTPQGRHAPTSHGVEPMSLSNDDDWSALSNMLPRNAAASGSSPHQGEAEPESDPGLMARRLARMGLSLSQAHARLPARYQSCPRKRRQNAGPYSNTKVLYKHSF
jgi:hypothetical protein